MIKYINLKIFRIKQKIVIKSNIYKKLYIYYNNINYYKMINYIQKNQPKKCNFYIDILDNDENNESDLFSGLIYY